MRVRVNDDDCVGDGSCAELCPDIFKMEGDLAIVRKEDVPQELEDLVREAAESCPVDAIVIDE
jgi:ferredoxin